MISYLVFRVEVDLSRLYRPISFFARSHAFTTVFGSKFQHRSEPNTPSKRRRASENSPFVPTHLLFFYIFTSWVAFGSSVGRFTTRIQLEPRRLSCTDFHSGRTRPWSTSLHITSRGSRSIVGAYCRGNELRVQPVRRLSFSDAHFPPVIFGDENRRTTLPLYPFLAPRSPLGSSWVSSALAPKIMVAERKLGHVCQINRRDDTCRNPQLTCRVSRSSLGE